MGQDFRQFLNKQTILTTNKGYNYCYNNLNAHTMSIGEIKLRVKISINQNVKKVNYILSTYEFQINSILLLNYWCYIDSYALKFKNEGNSKNWGKSYPIKNI